MSFVERFIVLCPYLGESTIRDSSVFYEPSTLLGVVCSAL